MRRISNDWKMCFFFKYSDGVDIYGILVGCFIVVDVMFIKYNLFVFVGKNVFSGL